MLQQEDIQEIKALIRTEALPVGAIMIFPSENIPDGYMVCDGRMLDKQEYARLYAVLGGIFGEDADCFNLPDLRGKFVRGYDTSGIYDPNKERRFGEYQKDALQGHTHMVKWDENRTGKSGAHHHKYFAEYWHRYKDGSFDDKVHENKDFEEHSSYNMTTNTAGEHDHPLPDITVGEMASTRFGKVNVSIETRPKNVALNFCIKVK